MPFTLAHPFILFPLKWINKKYISLTALVIGSMAPDFEYFIWMSPNAYVSHSVHGIYLFNLPLTFLFAFIFHITVKRPLLYHFPFFKDKYLTEPFDYASYLKNHWVIFTFSALLGIASHLVWDGFTHAQGYFVRHSNFLSEEISMGSLLIRRCYVAWYICSVAGLLLVAMYVLDIKKVFYLKTFLTLSSSTLKYWTMILLIAITLLALRMWWGLTWNWFRHLIITTMGALMYALIIVSWFENRRLKMRIN